MAKDSRSERDQSRVLLVCDSNDRLAAPLVRNVVTALDMARVAHDSHDLSGPWDWPDLPRYSAILMAVEALDRGVDEISRFVENGGGMGVLYPVQSPAFDQLFGIVPVERHPAAISAGHDGGGLHFPGRALPSFEGLELPGDEMIDHAGGDVLPEYRAEIVATTKAGKPVAWRHIVGRGAVVYWSSVFLSEKRARGLIIESLQCVEAVSVLPVANVGVIQIDDFPAPLNPPPNAALPGMSETDADRFYADIWYPDLKRLGRRHGLDYSCFAAFDYSIKPGDLPEAVPMVQSATFDAVLRLGAAEVGLHGLDHRPLCACHWRDEAQMRAALGLARDAWRGAGLGPLPTSYVPPNNEYDVAGVRALNEAMPSITTICGSYDGGEETVGQNREIGPEPWNPELLALPRASAGHECLDPMVFDAASQVAAGGVWTHFLHPDDVADMPGAAGPRRGLRNPAGRPWHSHSGRSGLLDQFDRFIGAIRQRAPWLRFLSTREAAHAVRQHLRAEWQIRLEGDRVLLCGPPGGCFRLRLNHRPWRRVEQAEGCEIVHETGASDYALYLIRLDGGTASLRLGSDTQIARLRRRLGRWQGPAQPPSDRNRPSPASVTRVAKSS